MENSLLQFAYFSDISSAVSLAGMSLFGGKNAPNTTPKCFQTQHHHRILEVEVQTLNQEGRERPKSYRLVFLHFHSVKLDEYRCRILSQFSVPTSGNISGKSTCFAFLV